VRQVFPGNKKIFSAQLPGLREQAIQCPYCGEHISILVDCSVEDQSYIEDCEVCCRPINLSIHVDNNQNIQLIVQHENE